MMHGPLSMAGVTVASRISQRETDSPLITIAIPAHNRPQMLAQALASIAVQTD
jgi:hypothetical protein